MCWDSMVASWDQRDFFAKYITYILSRSDDKVGGMVMMEEEEE